MGLGEFFTSLGINPLYVAVYAFLFGFASGWGGEVGKWMFRHTTKPRLEKAKHVTKRILSEDKHVQAPK